MSVALFMTILTAAAPLGAPGTLARAPQELGWLCFRTPSAAVASVALSNPHAFTGAHRFERGELDDTVLSGHLCARVVTRPKAGAPPTDAPVFERPPDPPPKVPGTPARSAPVQPDPPPAELEVTPADAELEGTVLDVTPLAARWQDLGNAWCFVAERTPRLRTKHERTFPDAPSGAVPDALLQHVSQARALREQCHAVDVTAPLEVENAALDRQTRTARPTTGTTKLALGTTALRCDDLAAAGDRVALARPRDRVRPERGVEWMLAPTAAAAAATRPLPGLANNAFAWDHPLGDYHLCRAPTWRSALMDRLVLGLRPELRVGRGWDIDGGPSSAVEVVPAGAEVSIQALQDGWAVVDLMLEGRPRTVVVRADELALPRGPAEGTVAVIGGECPRLRGQWREILASTAPLTVEADGGVGAAWSQLVAGTRLLAVCSDGVGATTANGDQPSCPPRYVGGEQTREGRRLVLVRYADRELAMPEAALGHEAFGELTLREARPSLWQLGPEPRREEPKRLAFTLGTTGRAGTVAANSFAVEARLQDDPAGAWGFQGALGFGVDGVGTVMQAAAGARHPMTPLGANLTLYGALLGRVDLYAARGGGLGFDAVAKVELRWQNEYVPAVLELGLVGGYGGRFSQPGRARIGALAGLHLELARF